MDRIYRVLLVDDEPLILQGCSKLLKSAGYEVLEAQTGSDGLALAKQEKPDLILLDVVLPDIGGFQVCERIKKDPELGQYALIEDDLVSVKHKCALLISQVLHVDFCGIYEPVHSGAALLLRAGVGWRAGLIDEASVDATADYLVGCAFQGSEAVMVADFSKDGRFRSNPLFAEHAVLAGLGVPIRGRGEAFGVLAVYTTSPRTFAENEVHFLQSVANVLAAAHLRKQSEEEVLKAGKFEAMGTLAGGIAHDFNNLLAIVLGNLNLMQLSSGSGSPSPSLLNDTEKAVIRASELSKRFLLFASGGDPVKKTVAIEGLLTDSVSLALAGSNVRTPYTASRMNLPGRDRLKWTQASSARLFIISSPMPGKNPVDG